MNNKKKGPLVQGERIQVSLVHKAAGEMKTSAKLEKTLASDRRSASDV